MRSSELPHAMNRVLAFGEDAPSLEERIAMLASIRAKFPEASPAVDRFLLDALTRQQKGLQEAEAGLREVSRLHEQLQCEPRHVAIYIDSVPSDTGTQAIVVTHGGAAQAVGISDRVASGSLQRGDVVLISAGGNAILEKLAMGYSRSGSIATFDRRMPDGRLVLISRDEEIVLEAAAGLDVWELQRGDQVRFDPAARMAFEKLERDTSDDMFLAEVPDHLTPDCVGGQDEALNAVILALTARLMDPDKAALYGLDAATISVLLTGPPGYGKTLIARVAAAVVGRMMGVKPAFGVVPPAGWEERWVGATQENIRNCFRAAREAADKHGFCCLFMDEIDAAGRIRGSSCDHYSDKFQGALLVEIQGFQEQKNVVLISATNRPDLLDLSLRERIGQIEIPVRRPDVRGARAIFQIHMGQSYPYCPNSASAAATRTEIIETAVSQLYAPNADNAIASIQFRDGKTRTVYARELVSGRRIEQMCRTARLAAFARDVRGGEQGISLADMTGAVNEAIDQFSTSLSPANASGYLDDLPQDVDVVSVEPLRRRAGRTSDYIRIELPNEEAAA